jgi:predicted ATPase/DNA-binding winged helix-turn-helix (wHTH) protein
MVGSKFVPIGAQDIPGHSAVTAYRFGSFELQPNQRRLLADNQPVALGDRAFEVLLALVERGGELVTKDELIGRVWPGVVVEENNLQVQVSTLRKILGAGAIATTAGRGYRFTLEIAAAGEPSKVSTPSRHNLPQQLTSFIGHEDDLEEYSALLEETRLLTLTGIGGCGKTRLAIKLGERVLPSFRDGVWYVDLAPLLDAERVPLTVATTLGAGDESDRPIVDMLCAYLARQRVLLVLDNCEHLSAACAALARRLIDAAPGVHVLAASREGLGVPGERTVTVRSLSLPSSGAKQDLQSVEGCEAVRLFVERAQLSIPKFALSDDTAPVVTEICRRLDGIPLAIELAAARVKLLSVEEIRARLDDRFRLLTGSGRAAMARQQTLLATIQWSYDHLAGDQKQLLRRLSVFVGGWTLEGAARVAGEAQDEYAVLDLLGLLVDRSLVTTHRVERGATRYSMLETVRQYAQDRLNEAREDEAARERHLQFYVALAEKSEPELVGRDQGAWLARLDPELENFLAAHACCDHAEGGVELGLRLVWSLKMYLRQRGLTALGHRITVEALARPGAQAGKLVRCRALCAAGEHSYFMGRYGESREYVEESLVIADEIQDSGRLAEGMRLLGYVALALGNRAAAREHFQASTTKSRQLDDTLQLSGSLNGLAELYRAEGELEQAEPLYEEALALSGARGDRGGTAIHLVNLAWTAIGLGRAEQARAMVREGLTIVEELGAKRVGVAHLDCLTGLAAAVGDGTSAARFYGATEAVSGQLGYRREPADEASLAPFVARTRVALGSAAFAAAESAGRALSYSESIGEARAWLGEAERGAGVDRNVSVSDRRAAALASTRLRP